WTRTIVSGVVESVGMSPPPSRGNRSPIVPHLTYADMRILSSANGTSGDDGRCVQRGGRAPAAADPGRPRRRRAARERAGGPAGTGSATGVQAPTGAPSSGGGRRA